MKANSFYTYRNLTPLPTFVLICFELFFNVGNEYNSQEPEYQTMLIFVISLKYFCSNNLSDTLDSEELVS